MASDPSPLYSKVTGSLLSLACSVCVPPQPLLIICAAGVIRSPHETRPAEIHALQKDAEKVFQAVDSRYNDRQTHSTLAREEPTAHLLFQKIVCDALADSHSMKNMRRQF